MRLDSVKRERLKALLADAVPQGCRFLVFSQWPSLLEGSSPTWNSSGARVCIWMVKRRTETSCKRPGTTRLDLRFLLISLKAGGAGLNLIRRRYRGSPRPLVESAVEAQAMDRCYRIGQTREVAVYKFIAKGTVEERVVRTQNA